MIFFTLSCCAYGQDTTYVEDNVIVHLPSEESYIYYHLRPHVALIRLRLYPTLNPNIIDSLNLMVALEIDSTWVFVKNSYSWNIDNWPPQIYGLPILKLMFKKRKKWSEEDEKLYNYLVFLSKDYRRYIEKFVFFQNYKIESKIFQAQYECTFK